MAPNRKHILIVIGLTVIATGGLLGSGAFSQVEADRQVTVQTAGDSAALLQMSVNDTYNGINSPGATGTNNEAIIEISLADINDDAVTTFNESMTITNNGANEVTLSIDTNSLSGITMTPSNATLAADGGSTTIKLEVDTTTSVSGGTITITATS